MGTLPEADVLFAPISTEMLANAKNLRRIQVTEAGMERLLFPELIKSNVVVTNVTRMFAPVIFETTIAITPSITAFAVPRS